MTGRVLMGLYFVRPTSCSDGLRSSRPLSGAARLHSRRRRAAAATAASGGVELLEARTPARVRHAARLPILERLLQVRVRLLTSGALLSATAAAFQYNCVPLAPQSPSIPKPACSTAAPQRRGGMDGLKLDPDDLPIMDLYL
ncbi:hypothetical protein ACP70R_033292 [Stipagrostis hirtigluma subsp. patula]